MIICVCKYRRGVNDKLIHETNLVYFNLASSTHTREGEIISDGRGKCFFRPAAHDFSSQHGWEEMS